MSDYIKREDAISIIRRRCKKYTTICVTAVTELQDLPPADVVEVVRCKDCKWYNNIGCSIKIVDDSDKPKDNDYCSFGERADT